MERVGAGLRVHARALGGERLPYFGADVLYQYVFLLILVFSVPSKLQITECLVHPVFSTESKRMNATLPRTPKSLRLP